MTKKQKYILWFKDISVKDVLLVGGKNASLGEMYSQLSKKGVNIPDGFALTSAAYWYFLKENKIDKKLKEIFRKFDPKSIRSLQETGKESRNLFLKAKFPEDLKKEILKAYKKISKKYEEENVDVAVRSSGTAEDLPQASFAGQFETFLNISGKENLLKAIKKCIASLFNDRAIAYKEEKGFSHLEIALSVGVQRMVRSDLASSGVIFTLDTETGFENVVLINSIFGVGEMIVKGKITPDEFYVFKPTLKKGFKSIIIKNLGRKTKKYIYPVKSRIRGISPKAKLFNRVNTKSQGIVEVAVPKDDQLKFSLTDDETLTLAKWACQIEDHYKIPQDIEWAKDGITGELFVVQSRPETVHAPKIGKVYEEYQLKTTKKPILTGIAIGDKIGQGRVKVIPDVSKIHLFQKGEVLVTKMTDPDWVAAFPLASAIVTDEGSKTCFPKDTLLLTNKGFLPIKDIVEGYKKEQIYVLSLNKENFNLGWQRVIDGMQRKAKVISVNISQTGKAKKSWLRVTPDHRFLTFNNRKLNLKEIQEILNKKEGVLSFSKISSWNSSSLSPKLGYLLGALATDGHIVFKKYDGKLNTQIFFSQKPTRSKKRFIKRMKEYFQEKYNYSLHTRKKPPAGGTIRGEEMKGGETIELKAYKKDIVEDILRKQEHLPQLLLKGSKEFVLNFLAGVIDGDGSFKKPSKSYRTPARAHIYCSTPTLFQAVAIGCLRLGINFQASPNRNILNIQLVDNIKEIFTNTARLRPRRSTLSLKEQRYFLSRQLLDDIKYKVNYKGRILPYIKWNRLINFRILQKYVLPKVQGTAYNHQLTQILNSPLKMLRVKKLKSHSSQKVYNITVEKNHNYAVFTKSLIPVVVSNCHAAIVSRELGIPAIVGTGQATKTLKTGQTVTVDCTQGLNGRIFAGKVSFEITKYDLKKIPKLKTKIMINIGAPEIAFKTSFLPNDGVGLARIEFILAEKIRIHPLALYHFGKLKNKKLKKKINELTVGYRNKKDYFIKELAEGISQIASAFYPKPVIVRLSDLKTNEYRALIGGEIFEPEEANPMLGWRGASRYYDEKFKPAFEMECKAIKRAREVFGLKNIWVMIPFCRTVEEGEKVLDLMAKSGLEKGKDNLKVIVMCEIPSNVILAEEFLEIFDGMSIGSNDLTQLVLGLDRDSAIVAKVGDERNEAVKEMVSKVIKLCQQKKKYCGICGDIPSTDIGFAQFLMKEGIESMSLSPDAVIKIILGLAQKK